MNEAPSLTKLGLISKLQIQNAFDEVITERDAALARAEKAEGIVETLQQAIIVPARQGTECMHCGRFSSALVCAQCNISMGFMPILAKYLIDLITAYYATTPASEEFEEAAST